MDDEAATRLSDELGGDWPAACNSLLLLTPAH